MNLEELSRAVVAGDIDVAEGLTKKAIASNIPVADILNTDWFPVSGRSVSFLKKESTTYRS